MGDACDLRPLDPDDGFERRPCGAERDIRPLDVDAEADACARWMITSEPWLTLGRSYEVCLRRVREPSREAYVAVEGGVVVGFILLNMQGLLTGYIQTVCVAPEVRGRGVGTRLLAFAEERIWRDSPNVFICVSSFNPRARELYLRRGYQLVGVLTDYLVAGHDELLLRKSCGPWAEFQGR